MEKYFRKLAKFYGDKYGDIRKFSQDIRLTPEEKIVVAVPVHSSEKTVSILEAYRLQKLDHRLFRIVLFLNRSESDNDFRHLERFIKNIQRQSSLKISYFKKSFIRKKPIGLIRKMLVDVILLASRDPNLIIVNNDCDTLFVDPNYLGEHIKQFEGERKQVRYSCGLDYYPSWVEDCGVFRLLMKFYSLFEQVYNDTPPFFTLRISTGDLACTAKLYTDIGGFNAECVVGEDLGFGYMGRVRYSEKIFKKNKFPVITSPRRLMNAYIKSTPLYSAWNSFPTDNALRGWDEARTMRRLKVIDKKTTFYYFQKEINLFFNYCLKYRVERFLKKDLNKITDFRLEAGINKQAVKLCERMFKRTLSKMGFSFKILKYPIRDYIVLVDKKDA